MWQLKKNPYYRLHTQKNVLINNMISKNTSPFMHLNNNVLQPLAREKHITNDNSSSASITLFQLEWYNNISNQYHITYQMLH